MEKTPTTAGNGRFIELKSWSADYINGINSRAFTDQLGNYFKQQANFTQIFDFDRIRFDAAGYATIDAAKTTIKAKYVTLFKKDLQGTFDAMGGETSAFLNANQINNFDKFSDAVNNVDPGYMKNFFHF
ncbi:MAG: hypothetical protein U5N85_15490 [Arcicella sp.]|nr:hypothetical protein [Arcicella sp.]